MGEPCRNSKAVLAAALRPIKPEERPQRLVLPEKSKRVESVQRGEGGEAGELVGRGVGRQYNMSGR